MTTKVGLASVSYGIGVQNRYSAFLDDEDNFVLSAPAALNQRRNQQDQLPSSSKLKLSATKSNGSLAAAMSNGPKPSARPQTESSGSLKKQTNDQIHRRQQHQDPRRPRRQLDGLSAQAPKQNSSPATGNNSTRQANFNQDKAAINHNNNNPKFSRNTNHQSDSSQHQQNKENNSETAPHGGRYNRNGNNFRPPSNKTQFQGEDRRAAGQQVEDSTGVLPNQSIEEEKRRRQQKRAIDLKHKDPEKREARRQHQAAPSLNADTNNQSDTNQLTSRSNRRQGPPNGQVTRNNDDNPSSRGSMRGRGRRLENGSRDGTNNSGDRREGHQNNNNLQRSGDRQPRNRNGFGAGSRASRGSRGESDQSKTYNRTGEKQKPIPNFSDKHLFPSLS